MRALAVILLSILSVATGFTASDRPKQYVMMAFDGSLSLGMWKATRDFSKIAEASIGKPVKFTYFISGVYYLEDQFKRKYLTPQHSPGSSAIGWGGKADDLLARYDQTNLAAKEGHEIASHAIGHWDGSRWSDSDWYSEFKQFREILTDFFGINGLNPTTLFPTGWIFDPAKITGFRAPQLGVSAGLWSTIKAFGYRYDTSKVSSSNYWPHRDINGNQWNFPLASLVIAGTGKKTLSMDYNFYVANSNALPDPAHSSLYQQQMLDTYLHYFQANYNGNRAPIHIGHHFSLWNNGAYWEAMKAFALKVCGLPDVVCGNYTELANFMDTTTPSQVADFEKSNFTAPAVPVRLTLADPGFNLDVTIQSDLAVALRGDLAQIQNGRVRLFVEGRELKSPWQTDVKNGTYQIDERQLRIFNKSNLRVAVSVENVNGLEVARSTQTITYSKGAYQVSNESEESRALLGDSLEAHVDETVD